MATKSQKKANQSRKFINKARELGVDEQDDPLDKILERIAKQKSKDKKPDNDK